MSLIVDIKKNLGDFHLDVSFEMNGGVLGLLGASGSGKSMTLMCVAGIVKPDSGRIVLNDRTLFDSEKNINLTPQERRVGYLFQNYALFPNMTVRQNILCGLHNEKDTAKKDRVAREMIDLMQLIGLEDHRPGRLSGGQQQRAALARILVGDPDLIVLDEPFSALDSHLREQLQIETKRLLKRFGKDVILVTHSRDEAFRLCGAIALLDSGAVTAHKETSLIFSDPESRSAAILTGCKNVVDAKKSGEYSVDVPSWGLRFETLKPVRDDLCAIGIRAHHFDPETAQNRFKVRCGEKTESPFEYNIQFRFENQIENSRDVWWLTAKEKRKDRVPEELGADPADIMLLYK
ncbi:MAG: ATP-binding cassette domain-containing protein [Oscillospiraceae bacterium]|nr:ATP-binding cassette domain-containing protein [Oscillospiraceae bacterium]